MASQWGTNSLAAGQSAGWFFARENLTDFLPVLQVMPLTPSFTANTWSVSPGGYPYLNQLGVSTVWSQLGDDLNDLVYYLVVENKSDNTIEYAFLESDLFSLDPPVTPPSSGLGSNSNYFLCNCSSILGLSVTINVTEDMVGSDGFGFQINAYSAAGDDDGAQQYVMTVDPSGNLYAAVDNWQSGSTQLINDFVPIATLPGAKLPAGYRLTMTLANDASGNISAATYTAVDNQGNTVADTTLELLELDVYGSTNPVTTADLAPIVAFQMNLVDWANGGSTVLSSGAGEITYSAASAMTVENTEPSCVDWNYGTVETANSIYSEMPLGPSQGFTQSFSITQAGAPIRRRAAVSHMLTPPHE